MERIEELDLETIYQLVNYEMGESLRNLLKNHIEYLQDRVCLLECLEFEGVEGWTGYKYAFDEYKKNKD